MSQAGITCNLQKPTVQFGREVCGDLPVAERREWLVTNGLGGFASGTVAGLLTRRYHGLLFAALTPPLGRTLLLASLQETAVVDGKQFSLAANRWHDGTIAPEGYREIERFWLEGTTPTWLYALSDARLEKRVWMEPDANTTYVHYRLLGPGRPVELELRALVNYRDYHATTRAGDWRMEVQPVGHGLRILPFAGATPFYLLSESAGVELAHEWYRNFELAVERYRGLDHVEDHLHVGTFRATLRPEESLTLVCSVDANPELQGLPAYQNRVAHEKSLLRHWISARGNTVEKAPAWVEQLVLAADQFIVRRPLEEDRDARSVIAGYPWFSDWGRDTMIALPGLALATGRPEIARNILGNFARFIDRGMLPNVFPDASATPEYNTVDATLWYFEAVRQYIAATGDTGFLRDLFPTLAGIIATHVAGTRYNIHVDPADGLLYAGERGVQLTWMDVKVGDWVVTPRIGKPVEVNALWLNALVSMAQFAQIVGFSPEGYELLADRVRNSFPRFWDDSQGYCFDVLDGPNGNDPSLRPNQIFAVALPESPLPAEQQRAVVDVCSRHLLTSHGLRSLTPDDPNYKGRYGGSPRDRDAAYHQGTAWGWLLGPFAVAHYRVYRDAPRAMSFLAPMADQLNTHGLGSAGEIFDGDAPFTPRGCIAQAWSVSELLRVWSILCQRQDDSKNHIQSEQSAQV
jgi:predicted glycogen debranching enzyme